MSKPSLPQGTRDFGPDVVRKRNYILTTIKNVFELYGFQPLETPAMENMETLMGKYGEEGDKLIFKILNNGLDNPDKKKQAKEDFEKVLQGKNVKSITERALKYDLTIPFARYVAMNHNQLTFPFKRYQIQPVWRADRPQKSRYREFYQCDADVVGSNSLANEIELLHIYNEVFRKLKVDVSIKINSRKILQGIADYCGYPNNLIEITTALDKLEKIGRQGVLKELIDKGIHFEKADLIFDCIDVSTENYNKNLCDACNEDFDDNSSINERKLICLKEKFLGIKTSKGIEGVNELLEIIKTISTSNISLEFDISLARGLNYYTGLIVEVMAENVQIGSIGGGGRYDDLTGLFGVPDIPGVGISFGVDRIYDVMEELNLFPDDVHVGTQVLFFNLGETESRAAFELMQKLRNKGVRCELFHEQAKFDRQFKYAEKKNIPYVIIIGSKELDEKNCMIKDLRTGEQQSVSFDQLPSFQFK